MSRQYRAVAWTPAKKKYDAAVAAFMLIYAAVFAWATLVRQPNMTAETLLMRISGSLAFVMLSGILLAGPLARISPRFLPVLRNRRHLGVATFFVALIHAATALFQFHFLGDLNPLVSLLQDGGATGGASAGLPFQLLGAAVLVVLFLMAATSHDFWLANLGPGVWKGLHMLAYPAYAVLLGHVAFGALQQEASDLAWAATAATATAVFGIHVLAAWRERTARTKGAGGEASPGIDDRGYSRTVRIDCLADAHGRVVDLEGRRVAVFRNGLLVACVSNVCSHQMGPLGEGKIVDGYITCPWHGFQFDPATGRAPAPYEDCIETYDTEVRGEWVWIRTTPNAPGATARNGQIREAAKDDATAEPAAKPRTWARQLTAASLAAAVATALVAAASQRKLPKASFEFGVVRSTTGFVVADPYPSLIIPRGPVSSRYLLVGPGKHGADRLVAGMVGKWAKLDGTLVFRDGYTMVEVVPGSVELASSRPPPQRAIAENLGLQAIEGEIVGAKCYMGVMNPGDGVVHRACAKLCIQGGVPPLLRATLVGGRTEILVLTGPAGEAVDKQVLDRVGLPVRATGTVVRQGSTLFFQVAPGDIRRTRS